ncbi:hypothetical protein ACFCXT_24820 [Streptomyces vinaceus]|uniref:hypothetical protein n=1 Tax=Streptomyces vinaceus TaxID=1960 RepID=UPI0035D90F38
MKSKVSASGSVMPRQPSIFMELLDLQVPVAGSPKKGCAFCTLCISVAERSSSPHRKYGASAP